LTTGLDPAEEAILMRTQESTTYNKPIEDSTGAAVDAYHGAVEELEILIEKISRTHDAYFVAKSVLRGARYEWVMRSCQHKASSSRNTHANPMPRETAER
jgi:predicted RNase H-like nuclease (RuvC/YqgF family)